MKRQRARPLPARTDPDGSFIQWMYGELGNREAAWRRKEDRGDTVDRVKEAFVAGWQRSRAARESSDL